MSGITPEQTICEYLATPEVVISSVPQPGASGWQGQTTRGGFGALPGSVHFGKMRTLGDRRVYEVTFTTGAGMEMRLICSVRRDAGGDWRLEGGAGGAAGGDPVRGYPWVNVGGSYGSAFYAGGRVLEHGSAVARVRLTGANGYALEDTPDEDDIVLFLADDPPLPLQIELLDGAGQIIARDGTLG